jgi:tetratricopeptide (TPR) repeat protein
MRNTPLIVATLTALLTFGAGAQQQTPSDNGQSVPDAPQPQKKPAAKTPPPADAPPSKPDDKPAPTPPPAKDENAFPEDVSRQAAKAATQSGSDGDASSAGDHAKQSGAQDNPFPEAVSRDAAKAAANDQEPAPAVKKDLPPGVSSSQSALPEDGESAPQVADPARAKKDSEVGGFYLKSGDYQGALLRYRDATASDPANVDAIFGLAEAQRLLGKNADAARSYQMYLEIVPNGPRAKQALKALKTLPPGK